MISNHFLCKDVVHHPIEPTIYIWLAFGLPGIYQFSAWQRSPGSAQSPVDISQTFAISTPDSTASAVWSATWRMGLPGRNGYVVNNHGTIKSPKWGCGTPYKWPFMAYKWELLTTYWDDPPSISLSGNCGIWGKFWPPEEF